MALAVAVVPLLIDLSNLDDTYYAGKARALFILAPVIVAGLLLSRGIPILRRTRLLTPLMAFVMAVAMATAVSVNPLWSVVGAPRRHEGLLSLVAYAVMCAGTLVVVVRGGLRVWLAAVLAGGTLAGLYGIAQYFGIELIVRDSVRVDWWRPFSTSGNPNFLGAYMVLIAPLAAAALLTVRRRTVAVLSLAALTVTVITALCTYSRAAWLGLAVAAALFGVLGARRPTGVDARTVRYRLAGVGAVLVVLAGMFLLLIVPWRPHERTGRPRSERGLRSNLRIRKVGSGGDCTSGATRFSCWRSVRSWDTAQRRSCWCSRRGGTRSGPDCSGRCCSHRRWSTRLTTRRWTWRCRSACSVSPRSGGCWYRRHAPGGQLWAPPDLSGRSRRPAWRRWRDIGLMCNGTSAWSVLRRCSGA